MMILVRERIWLSHRETTENIILYYKRQNLLTFHKHKGQCLFRHSVVASTNKLIGKVYRGVLRLAWTLGMGAWLTFTSRWGKWKHCWRPSVIEVDFDVCSFCVCIAYSTTNNVGNRPNSIPSNGFLTRARLLLRRILLPSWWIDATRLI